MASSEGSNDGNAIQLDTMSLDQLDQLKQREESRLQALSARYAQLRQVAARLTASQTAVQELAAPASSSSSDDIMDTDTKEVFVPLTESVYVPGKIKTAATTNDKDLLVELGTGYYVEKSSGETVEFLDRKIKIVDANSENGNALKDDFLSSSGLKALVMLV